MKKGDWVLVTSVALVAGLISFLSMNSLFSDQVKPTESVPTSIVITDSLAEPSEFVYSANNRDEPPINPAIITRTGGGEEPASDTPEENDSNYIDDVVPEENDTGGTEENIDEGI